MSQLELTFASKEDSLSVRRFSIREELSGLFEVSIFARSELDDIDFETIVGRGASFKIASGVAHAATGSRLWTGVVSHMEQIQAESSGLSTYYLRLAPALWRTTLRRNNRVFQHLSIPAIVSRVLEEWAITPELKLDAAAYPKFEYRVQYDETDYAFIGRLLEEAGVSFYFSHGEGTEKGKHPSSKLVLTDEPQRGEPRAGGPIPYVDSPNESAERDFVTNVRMVQRVRPGHLTIRDYDFRTKADFKLAAEARSGNVREDRFEHYHYQPGAFLVEQSRSGDTPSKSGGGPRPRSRTIAAR